MAIDQNRRQKLLAKKSAKRKEKRIKNHSSLRVNFAAKSVAHFPIYECLASTNIFEHGLGTTMLSRKLPDNNLALSVILIDSYCLGVKNAMFRLVSIAEYSELKRKFGQNEFFETIHPSCLRKMVHGAVQYAKNLGFHPHSDYASASLLFGDIDATACPVHYEYGYNGKPFYIQGPNETPAQVRKIMQTLGRSSGRSDSNYSFGTDLEDMDIDDSLLQSPETISYEITDEPLKNLGYRNIPESIKDQLEKFYNEELAHPEQAIEFLIPAIKRYPDVPQLQNMLFNAYIALEDLNNAKVIAHKTVELFPNYFFGYLALAQTYLIENNLDMIQEIFEDKYDIGLLYPERKVFHITEVIGFNALLTQYFYAKGDQEAADRHYDIMRKIDPDNPVTKTIKRVIYRSLIPI